MVQLLSKSVFKLFSDARNDILRVLANIGSTTKREIEGVAENRVAKWANIKQSQIGKTVEYPFQEVLSVKSLDFNKGFKTVMGKIIE